MSEKTEYEIDELFEMLTTDESWEKDPEERKKIVEEFKGTLLALL